MGLVRERRRCRSDEDDISAEEEIQSKGSWIQGENENSRRKKSIICEKSKGKKSIDSIGRRYVAFFATARIYPGQLHFSEKEEAMKFSESLKKYEDFQRVYKKGRSYANRYLIMYCLKQDMQGNRIGISVSKKVGNSVIRHRITRLIRESYRLNEPLFVRGLDIVVIARPGAKGRSFSEIESALLHLGRLHQIFGGGEQKKEVKKENEEGTDFSN